MDAEWDLSQTLTSDGQGIRAVAVTPDDDDRIHVVTGSQAGTVVRYTLPSAVMTSVGAHPHAVTAVAAMGPYIVTGCKDAAIRVFAVRDDDAATLQTTLSQHEKPVTSLAFYQVEDQILLLSGSWDGTAKLWKLESDDKATTKVTMVATLAGHENSVCVTFLPSTSLAAVRIATGSAGIAQNNRISGHAVRLWTVNVHTGGINQGGGEPVRVSDDHQGPIRDICYLSTTDQLATCSNDGTVKLRNPNTGVASSTLTFVSAQHPPMLLSVCGLADGTIVAGAEDGHVVVWNTGTGSGEPQILRHAVCVWRVGAMGKEDFYTAADDGQVRIFTRDTERMADAAVRQAFSEAAAAAAQAASQGPTPEEVAKLPDWETNATRQGTSEGQVQLFRKGSIAIAAQWSMASRCWIEVGQVMGQAGDGGGGGTIDGVAYDHVLPIEVDTTGGEVARLQVGYNTGENPFTAAQRFIDAHMLPQYHLAQIADYIQQRVGQGAPTIGMDTATSAAPSAPTGVPTVSYEHLPSSAYLSFGLTAKTVGTLDKIVPKITDANVLTEAETASLGTLKETLAATNRYHASTIADDALQVLPTLLTKLQPATESFPALDLARMTILHPDAAKSARATYWTGLLTQTIALGHEVGANAGPAVPMLSLRLVANAFAGGPGTCQAVSRLLEAALQLCAALIQHSNKNVRLSVATVLHNVCHYIHKNSPANPAVVAGVLPLLDQILSSRTWEEAAVLRTLKALGTLVLADAAAKGAAQAMFLASKVELAASPHASHVKETAKEVYRTLQ